MTLYPADPAMMHDRDPHVYPVYHKPELREETEKAFLSAPIHDPQLLVNFFCWITGEVRIFALRYSSLTDRVLLGKYSLRHIIIKGMPASC